jgi:cell division protein FtsB
VNPAWVAALVALAGIFFGFLAWFFRATWHNFVRVNQFLEDWNGAPADRGHAERPGVMARIAHQEALMTDVQSQVHLNGGGSLRDEVKRTEAAVEQLTSDVADVKSQVGDLKIAVEVLKARP